MTSGRSNGDALPHPFTVHDMLAMERISDPQTSPDGQWIVFDNKIIDLEDNKGRSDLWLVRADGSGLRRLTTHSAGSTNPRWSPDGRFVWFLSPRSGTSQVWRIAVDGGEAEQCSDEPLDVAALRVSPDGRHIAYAMEVFPDVTSTSPSSHAATPDNVAAAPNNVAATLNNVAAAPRGGHTEVETASAQNHSASVQHIAKSTKDRLEEREKAKASGRLYDRLFIRHWDTWKDGRRSHLFVRPVDGGEAVDVMRRMDADVPSKPFGDTAEFTFTPDGDSIVFAVHDAGREEAWSTSFNLYLAPVNGAREPALIVDGGGAAVSHPVFSPDGKTLAYLAMRRPGYEADRWRIVLKPWPDGDPRILTEGWDRSPSAIAFSPNGREIYTVADNLGQKSLFAVEVESGRVRILVEKGKISSPIIAGGRIVFGLCRHQSPVELHSVNPNGTDFRAITQVNAERLSSVQMGDSEQFTFPGWSDEEVYAYVVKPVAFDPSKKYPVAFLIHGGPQGSFGNDFHYRWNPQAYAGAGYAAVMVDFHGSTGYGQAFTDSIADDWGGKPFIDLQKGLAAALDRYEWMDGGRVAALGASYGGYMINWIAGNWPDRFRCLVNHDGNLCERIAYYDTEELWFPEWERRGTPWENPEAYEKHNPINYVGNWKTPMLVIHGALDYRVVDTQGISTFTALQRRSIPSKLLYFPDENHWCLKPANSIQWHETVLAWLDQWTK